MAFNDTPRPKDLDEYLGEGKVVRIALHRDADALDLYQRSFLRGPDIPERIYVIDGDSVISPEQVAQTPASDAKPNV